MTPRRWLSDPFVQENFKFYGTELQGQQEHDAQMETVHPGHRQCAWAKRWGRIG